MPPASAASPSPRAPPVSRARLAVPWALAPIAAAVVYVAAHALIGRSPALEEMIPDDAIASWRYHDLAAYDAAHASPADPFRPSDVLGSNINLPALPGIARDRPLLKVWLEPARRANPLWFVLPVDDAGKVRRTFRDPDLVERHAQHVVVRGTWAAASWDHAAVERAGDGHGVAPPSDPDSTWSVAADWPALVDFALLPPNAAAPPYAGPLAALGFLPTSAKRLDGNPSEIAATVEAGRVAFVRDAWTRVSLAAYPDRVRAELLPAPSSELVPLLAAWARETTSSPAPEPLADADAWIRVPDGAARRIVVLALWYAGVAWPNDAIRNGFAALRLDANGAAGAITVGAQGNAISQDWTVLWATPAASTLDTVPLRVPAVAPGATATVPAGAGALRAPFGGAPPEGELARRSSGDVEIVGVGTGAAGAAQRWANELRSTPLAPVDGRRVIARGFLRMVPAQRLLGPAIVPGGLLGSLAEGDVDVALTTDGVRLILDLQRVAK